VTPSSRCLAILLLGTVAACGQPQVAGPPPPASPEATVGQFLAAVNADDLRRMATLFGDARGPSPSFIGNAARRDSIMAVLQRVLASDSSRVTGVEAIPGQREWRLVHVDLAQGARRTSVPFTVLPWRGGWLVQKIDILPLMPGGAQRPSP
jgi:hypothetical protein